MNKNQNGFSHLAIILIIAVIGVIGVAGWRVMDKNRSAKSNQSQSVLSQDVLPGDLAGIKPIGEILTAAQTEIGERKVIQIELNQEDLALIYEITLKDGSTLVYDAKTGEKLTISVKDTDNEKDDDGDDPLPAGFKPSVSLQDVLSKAKAEHPGIEVRKVELEVEDGVVVFSVRFVDKFRVDIDAADGSILRIKSPDGPDVKIKDDDADIDDDGQKNDQDDDDDNNGVKNVDDDDDEGDGVNDDKDADDDNDGEDDDEDEDDEGDRSGSNSGSN